MSSPTKSFRFGPGFAESLTVRVWTKRGTEGRCKAARVTGTVRLARTIDYDTLEVDERFTAWEGEVGIHEDARLVWDAFNGDDLSAHALAMHAVDYACEKENA